MDILTILHKQKRRRNYNTIILTNKEIVRIGEVDSVVKKTKKLYLSHNYLRNLDNIEQF